MPVTPVWCCKNNCTTPEIASQEQGRIGVMRERLHALDTVRGLALLGILINHIFYVSFQPAVAVLQDFHAIAFVLLAGVMMTYVQKDSHVTNVVRAIVVGIIALVIGAGNPPIDLILLNFAWLFLLGEFIFKKRSTWFLLVTAGIVGVAGPVLSRVIRAGPGDQTYPNVGVQHLLSEPWLLVLKPFVYGHYPLLQWSAVFLVGMGIGRLLKEEKFRDACMHNWEKIAGGALVVCLAITALSMMVVSPDGAFAMGSGNVPVTDSWRAVLWSSYAYSGTTLGLIRGVGVTVLVIALLLPLCRRSNLVGRLGASTLSVYSLHALSMLFFPVEAPLWASGVFFAMTLLFLGVFVLRWQNSMLLGTGPVEGLVAHMAKLEVEKRKS